MNVMSRLLQRSDGDAPRVSIEPMRRRHLREVMPIERGAYPKPWSKSVFESELDHVKSGSRYYLVARTRGRTVGYAGLWIVTDPDGDQAHVTNLVVSSDHRREGVATRLMLALADEAIERECVAWTLEVRTSATGAQELYRQFGFAPAGIRRRYYENTEDAIVMWCHEIRSPGYRAQLRNFAVELPEGDDR